MKTITQTTNNTLAVPSTLVGFIDTFKVAFILSRLRIRKEKGVPALYKMQKHGMSLMVRVLIATAMGALLGYFFQGYTDYVAVFGKVYANLLMVFVISLLLFSMIATIINIGDMKTLGSIGETDDWNRWRS